MSNFTKILSTDAVVQKSAEKKKFRGEIWSTSLVTGKWKQFEVTLMSVFLRVLISFRDIFTRMVPSYHDCLTFFSVQRTEKHVLRFCA